VGLAMSQDGRNWARIEAEHHTGAVLDAGEPGEWDAAFVGAPQVMRPGTRPASRSLRSQHAGRAGLTLRPGRRPAAAARPTSAPHSVPGEPSVLRVSMRGELGGPVA